MKWPSRAWGQRKVRYVTDLSDTGLVSAITMQNVDDLAPNLMGAGDGDIAGPVYAESILDSAQTFGQDGGIQTAFNSKISIVTHVFTIRKRTSVPRVRSVTREIPNPAAHPMTPQIMPWGNEIA